MAQREATIGSQPMVRIGVDPRMLGQQGADIVVEVPRDSPDKMQIEALRRAREANPGAADVTYGEATNETGGGQRGATVMERLKGALPEMAGTAAGFATRGAGPVGQFAAPPIAAGVTTLLRDALDPNAEMNVGDTAGHMAANTLPGIIGNAPRMMGAAARALMPAGLARLMGVFQGGGAAVAPAAAQAAGPSMTQLTDALRQLRDANAPRATIAAVEKMIADATAAGGDQWLEWAGLPAARSAVGRAGAGASDIVNRIRMALTGASAATAQPDRDAQGKPRR